MKKEKDFLNLIQNGEKITLKDILDAREKRADIQFGYMTSYPTHTLVSFKLNIPGNIKKNEVYKTIFENGINNIEKKISENLFSVILHDKRYVTTGDEAYWVLNSSSVEVKNEMINLEESIETGRLYDIDVLYMEEKKVKTLKRVDVGVENRKCYVCLNRAKECARNQTHTKKEMYKAISEMIYKDPEIN